MNLDDRAVKWAERTPFGKTLLAVSCAISYLCIYSAGVAAVLFAGLVLHEVGHATAARLMRLPVRGIYCFPWFGGRCYYSAPIRSWRIWSFTTAAGPLVDASLATVVVMFASVLDSAVLFVAAFMTAVRAWSNLYPRGHLDGSKMLRTVMAPRRVSSLGLGERALYAVLWVGLWAITLVVGYGSFTDRVVDEPQLLFSPIVCAAINASAAYLSRLLF